MSHTEIHIEENIKARNAIAQIKSLVEFEVTKEKKAIYLNINKDEQNSAQMRAKTIHLKQLKLKQNFTFDIGQYYGCCTLPNGLMVFADNTNNEVKIVQSNGSLKSSIFFKGGAYDVTVINENQVAVSNSKVETISILFVDKSEVIRKLKTN